MDATNIKLVDIGNTHAKIYENGKIKYVKSNDFFLDERFFYISVNQKLNKKLEKFENAINLEKYINIKSNYKGLGVDRKILCSYIDDGVIVDAGSAVTVDIVENRYHLGGYIYPGIAELFNSYERISPVLKVSKIDVSDITKLPQNTQEAINFAVIKSLVLFIKDVSKDKKIYFCGGDGKLLSSYFGNSVYEEDLIFKAMKKIIKDL